MQQQKKEYTFDSSSSPSFLQDNLEKYSKKCGKDLHTMEQHQKNKQYFFFNIKEIMDNKFGTPAPVPYQDWSHPIPNQMTGTITPLRVEVKCFGKYTFKIENPAMFMNEVAGTANIYKNQT